MPLQRLRSQAKHSRSRSRLAAARVGDDEVVEFAQRHAGGAHLLGYDAAGAHAGNGVDLDQVGTAFGRDDEIHAHDAPAAAGLVGRQRETVEFGRGLRCDLSRRDLVRIARLVFGLEIEELLFRPDLRDREQVFPAAGDQYAAAHFAAADALLDEHFVALGEGAFDGGGNFAGSFDARHAEAAARGVGLDEERQSQFGRECVGIDGVAAADEPFARQPYARDGDGALGRNLVEGDDRRGH